MRATVTTGAPEERQRLGERAALGDSTPARPRRRHGQTDGARAATLDAGRAVETHGTAARYGRTVTRL